MKHNAAETEFMKADWKSVGLRLLLFARYWAKSHYGWYEGKLMPGSVSPEDVASEVYTAHRRGIETPEQNDVRRFNDKDPMWTQLKRSVKSVLWNIHKLKESRITSAEGPEFFDPILDEKPSPDAELRSVEFCEELFRLMFADVRVKRNDDLKLTIQAYESGARGATDLQNETGLTRDRVYEMRKAAKAVAETVLNKMNRDGVGHEQEISKRSTKTA
jgi:hypothetical protein